MQEIKLLMTYLHSIVFILIIFIGISCKGVSNKTTNTKQPENNPSSKTNYNSHNVSWSEIQALGKLPYDYLIPYGQDSLQFGELRVPEKGKAPFPIIVFIHGGCWLSDYSLDYLSAVCADLVKEGYAVWTPEYRRIGDKGGGFPNTFKDIQKSIQYLTKLAEMYPIDAKEVVLMGHSAGGHLALWMASQQQLPTDNPLYLSNPLAIKGVLSLAGITDLIAYDKIGNDCSTAVVKLMNGSPTEVPENYQVGNPINLLPTKVPIRLINGALDNIVPVAQSEQYAAIAKSKGMDAKVVIVKGAGHFDMVSPYSAAWEVIKKELDNLVN